MSWVSPRLCELFGIWLCWRKADGEQPAFETIDPNEPWSPPIEEGLEPEPLPSASASGACGVPLATEKAAAADKESVEAALLKFLASCGNDSLVKLCQESGEERGIDVGVEGVPLLRVRQLPFSSHHVVDTKGATLWPSGEVLAHFVARRLGRGHLKDRRVLELGCGVAPLAGSASASGACRGSESVAPTCKEDDVPWWEDDEPPVAPPENQPIEGDDDSEGEDLPLAPPESDDD